MTAQTRSEIATLMEKHGLAPIHRLGQHFLADANITRKIVSLAGVEEGGRVVEVGAGTGTLTRALAEKGYRVVAYEIDKGLRPLLHEVTKGIEVDLRFEDASKEDFGTALPGGPWAMVANLPYNVGTPLVMEALRRAHQITRFVVMVQKEVADRFAAAPGSSAYGLPSVVAGIHSESHVAFSVPPQVFYPPPKVESAVVVLDRVAAPANSERAIELARAGFAQRRKMLRRSLVSVLDDPVGHLETHGIDPTVRAEELSPQQWLELAS